MKKLLRPQPIFIGFAGLFCTFVGLNFYIYEADVDISAIRVNAANTALSDRVNTKVFSSIISGEWHFSQTLARPIFSPTRREYTPDTQPFVKEPYLPKKNLSAVTAAKQSSILFKGTRLIGSEPSVLVQLDETKTPQWYTIGGKIGEWTIAEIDAEKLTLASKTETIKLELFQTKVGINNVPITTNTQ